MLVNYCLVQHVLLSRKSSMCWVNAKFNVINCLEEGTCIKFYRWGERCALLRIAGRVFWRRWSLRWWANNNLFPSNMHCLECSKPVSLVSMHTEETGCVPGTGLGAGAPALLLGERAQCLTPECFLLSRLGTAWELMTTFKLFWKMQKMRVKMCPCGHGKESERREIWCPGGSSQLLGKRKVT